LKDTQTARTGQQQTATSADAEPFNNPTADTVDSAATIALAVLAGEKRCIAYRPEFAKSLGSITAAILLQQVIYRWSKVLRDYGRHEFFKFSAPCAHPLYKSDDSWQEELGFSRSELETALKRIGTKIVKGMNKADVLAVTEPEFTDGVMTNTKNLVVYWTDSERVTYYRLNVALLGNAIKLIYPLMQESRISKEMQESRNTLPTKKTTKNTHRAPQPPTAEPARASVCIGSKHSKEVLNRYAGANGLGQGWLTKAKDTGKWDDGVDTWLSGKSVEQTTTPGVREATKKKLESIAKGMAESGKDESTIRASLVNLGKVLTPDEVSSIANQAVLRSRFRLPRRASAAPAV
jgi:hypothetical protein